MYAVALFAFTCSAKAEHTQFIDANLAGQADKWDKTPQNGIPCMQTYAPYAFLSFDVTVPEPGAVYKLSLSLVKVTNGATLRVFIDNNLEMEIDTFATTNRRETILICDRFFTAGKHSVKIKNVGQTSPNNGNHLSVIGFEISGLHESGKWQVEEQTFKFTPIPQKEPSALADYRLTALPPRLQDKPFSIPPDSETADIFSHPVVLVNNIPFRIPKVSDVPETGYRTAEQKPLQIQLPESTREMFLLIWSKIPPYDTDGGPSKPPIAPITQSERFTLEVVYADGSSEHFIPFNLTHQSYGLTNGLALYVFQPRRENPSQRLVFHDNISKCSFSLLALTCNPNQPVWTAPLPSDISPWYPVAEKDFPAVTRQLEFLVQQSSARVSDGLITAEVQLQRGLTWKRLHSPAYGHVNLNESPIFACRQNGNWIGSDQWNVVDSKALANGVLIQLKYREAATHLEATVRITLAADGQIKMGLKLLNAGNQPFHGRIRFPILEGVKLKSLEDTWYYFPENNGASMIHHVEGNVYGAHGAGHPLQVDSFFNPNEWYALTLLSNDLEGQFHWYDVGKGEDGGWYRLEYLEKQLKPDETWTFPNCILSISPGDWRDSFRLYRDWVNTWYKPKPQAQDWYTQSFLNGAWYVYSGLDRMVSGAQNIRELFACCDVMTLAGWHAREHPDNPTHRPDYTDNHRQEYSGEYDHHALFPVGGVDHFKATIRQANESGVPISLYTNPILINENAHRFGAGRREWGIGYRPVDYGNMMGYVPCLSFREWLDYLVESQKFLTHEVGAKVVYLDQLGNGASICNRKNHSHEMPLPHFYGERELTRRIRAAIPEDVVICSESHPEDTRLQYQNGMYQGAVLRHFTKQIAVPVNLTRFAFPDIKCFNNIYNHVLKDNNWDQLKFVLFNGDAFFMPRAYAPESYFGSKAISDHRKMFRILHENVEAFTSANVEPLIPTFIPGTFVNQFMADNSVIWTVFNANYRTVKGKLLEIDNHPKSQYVDLWNGAPITISRTGKTASLVVEIGPRDVACISEITP